MVEMAEPRAATPNGNGVIQPPPAHRPPTAHCTLCWCQTSSSRLFVRLIVRKKRLPGTPPIPPLLSHRLKTVNFNRFMCSVSIVGRHHIRSDVSLRRCRFSPVLSGSLRPAQRNKTASTSTADSAGRWRCPRHRATAPPRSPASTADSAGRWRCEGHPPPPFKE